MDTEQNGEAQAGSALRRAGSLRGWKHSSRTIRGVDLEARACVNAGSSSSTSILCSRARRGGYQRDLLFKDRGAVVCSPRWRKVGRSRGLAQDDTSAFIVPSGQWRQWLESQDEHRRSNQGPQVSECLLASEAAISRPASQFMQRVYGSTISPDAWSKTVRSCGGSANGYIHDEFEAPSQRAKDSRLHPLDSIPHREVRGPGSQLPSARLHDRGPETQAGADESHRLWRELIADTSLKRSGTNFLPVDALPSASHRVHSSKG